MEMVENEEKDRSPADEIFCGWTYLAGRREGECIFVLAGMMA